MSSNVVSESFLHTVWQSGFMSVSRTFWEVMQGETCLHAAASWDNVVAANWLLLHGADVAAQDKKGSVTSLQVSPCSACVRRRRLLRHVQPVNRLLIHAIIGFLCNLSVHQ